ncbi:MAG TPA: prephenate dehydratase [Clostridiaceae bacterium]|nr:prephenate dehydratase [Clostridiaceae bacterium]
MIKIGFLGPKGTFTHEALRGYTKSRSEYVECDFGTIADMLVSVNNNEIDEAIVPIENSIEGGSIISNTLDMLAYEVDLKIKAEIVLKVAQNLLVPEGVGLSDIECILSHPQALGQCRKYIDKHFPGIMLKATQSTAGAALEAARSGAKCAVIGSASLADVYGLKVLEHSIQDTDTNETRFIVVSKTDGERTGRDKSSIAFSMEEDKPGSLYRILNIFNLWDINMTRIESRPTRNKLGKYIFFVDLMGHRLDEDLRDALTMVKRKTSFYKFLGSYPMAGSREITQ